MSDSVRPHRGQPTRLPCPWDSPAKNTGVGCHFLLQCMKVKSESEVAQSCPTLRDPMDCSPPGSSVHGIFQARVLEWGAIAFSKMAEWCPPKDRSTVWPLGPVDIALFGKGVFADIIQLIPPRWGHPGLSEWAPDPVTNVLIEEKRRCGPRQEKGRPYEERGRD